MQRSPQRVEGSLQTRVGPQPVDPNNAVSRGVGSPEDLPASIAAGSSMNAKLGRIMQQNTEIIEWLAYIAKLLEEGRNDDAVDG